MFPLLTNKCKKKAQLSTKARKFIFFDRDGTIIEKVHHLRSIEEICLVDKLTETLEELVALEFSFALVTNQSVIGRGMSTFKEVEEINNFILKPLVSKGITFDYVLVCPHVSTDKCLCRKPNIGLIDNIPDRDNIDFKRSFMVGDQESDVLFGKNLEMKTILISTDSLSSAADYIVNSFSQVAKAVQWIQLSGKLDS